MVTVAECERVQTAWFRTRALELGGEVWHDDDALWIDGPDGMNLMFPRAPSSGSVQRGVDRARDMGRGIVGAWLGSDADPAALAGAGFERGWSPCWMAADLATVPAIEDARIALQNDSLDYGGEYAAYRDQLALTRIRPPVAWYAAAHTMEGHRFAGRAWSYLDADLAGVFDMAVWPAFRRQRIGTGLLSAVCTAARQAGATHAVLNATNEGRLLYATCGFAQIGEGATWWLTVNHG